MARHIPRMFYLNKELHKLLKEQRVDNSIIAWNYPQEKRMLYQLTLVRKNFEFAFSVLEVASLLKIKVGKLKVLLAKNMIHVPSSREYKITNKTPMSYWFSEDDILKIRDDLQEMIPRNNDGSYSSVYSLPSRGELMAEMRGESKLYMKNHDGTLIRVWRDQ